MSVIPLFITMYFTLSAIGDQFGEPSEPEYSEPVPEIVSVSPSKLHVA